MLKRLGLSVVLACLLGTAHAQSKIAPVAPKITGAPAISIDAPALNSLFDGSGSQRFDVRSFLKTDKNGMASRKKDFKQATSLAKAAEFATLAQKLFGNPRVFTRRQSRGRITASGVPTDGEMDGEIRMSPKDNAEREKVIQQLFVQAGARADEIRSQDIGRGKHNFIVVKKGRTDKVIVVGGHHDKVSAGMGTIDNWTGATMVANLYQQIRDLDTEHTYIFIAFGREEEGLLGSAAYIRSLSQAERSKIENMVNLDTLGVDGTFSWHNNSDKSLLDQFRATADRERLELQEVSFDGGDADSSSFRKAGIPAITVFGCSPELIFDIIHSSRDNFGQFVLKHYVNAYKLTAAALIALDRATPGVL